MLKNQKGITLVSLVITIIVLIILATVAIVLAVDSNGLFNRAGQAVNDWNEAHGTEQNEVTNIMTSFNTITNDLLGN